MKQISIFSPILNISPLIKRYFPSVSVKNAVHISDYTNNVDFLANVATSNLHLINNISPLNNRAAASLIQAFLYQVPILLTAPPSFTDEVPYLVRSLINKRLNKIYIGDISLLDETDRGALLNEVCSPINYVLSANERVLAKASIRSFLRAQI